MDMVSPQKPRRIPAADAWLHPDTSVDRPSVLPTMEEVRGLKGEVVLEISEEQQQPIHGSTSQGAHKPRTTTEEWHKAKIQNTTE